MFNLQILLCCCCGCCCCCCDILRSWMMATSSLVIVLSTKLRTLSWLHSPAYSNACQPSPPLKPFP